MGKGKYKLSCRTLSPVYHREETSNAWGWKCMENYVNFLSPPKKNLDFTLGNAYAHILLIQIYGIIAEELNFI